MEVPDFARLYAKLNNTKLQTTNTPLWELLKSLIGLLIQFAELLVSGFNGATDSLLAFKNRTYITVENESAYFPFSRQLLAGTGITFDDSIANERTISSSSTGSYMPVHIGGLAVTAGDTLIAIPWDEPSS